MKQRETFFEWARDTVLEIFHGRYSGGSGEDEAVTHCDQTSLQIRNTDSFDVLGPAEYDLSYEPDLGNEPDYSESMNPSPTYSRAAMFERVIGEDD